jgi:hypothetical protein
MHGHTWLASFNSVKHGSWCPECKAAVRAMSYGDDANPFMLLSAE